MGSAEGFFSILHLYSHLFCVPAPQRQSLLIPLPLRQGQTAVASYLTLAGQVVVVEGGSGVSVVLIQPQPGAGTGLCVLEAGFAQ